MNKILLCLALTISCPGVGNASLPPVLHALHTEMQRAMTELAGKDVPPYFISYTISDVSSSIITASFGAIEQDNSNRRRVLDIDLRVGSHELDNTRSIRGVALEFGRLARGVSIPLSDDEKAIRTVVWVATDATYKAAVERYGKVLTNIQVKVREEDTSADLSHEHPHRRIITPPSFSYDTTHWRTAIRRLSLVGLEFPDILSSRVSLATDYTVTWFVNSEGSLIVRAEPVVKLFLTVMTKASDGMSLPLYRSYTAYSADNLPDEQILTQEFRAIHEQSLALAKAPLFDTYSGPAILSGRSSGVFFHEIFGHRVEGHRQKDVNSSQTFKAFLGKKILPTFINVVFDPTIRKLDGTEVAGFYEFDDEGIPAQRVVAVDQGIFKNFLMSRSPIEHFHTSNGHGRRQAGYRCVSRQSNLIVEATSTVTPARLRELLREECRKQEKEFGLLFDDIQGGFTFTGRTIPNAFNVQPLVVYKIFVDGRPDELVRGVDMIGTPLTTFNNIVAASNDRGIFNGICGAESGGVPVSASSPSLLVSSIEVQKKQKSQAKLPLLPPPPFNEQEIEGAQ